MGFLDSVKAWFTKETAELKDATSDLEARLDRDLSRRERILEETPTEAMERLQEEIAEGESAFDALEDKIGRSQAKADAVADLAEDPPEDVVDLDSEEIE